MNSFGVECPVQEFRIGVGDVLVPLLLEQSAALRVDFIDPDLFDDRAKHRRQAARPGGRLEDHVVFLRGGRLVGEPGERRRRRELLELLLFFGADGLRGQP